MEIRLLTPAEKELEDAFDFYEKQIRGLGSEFIDDILAAFKRIRTNPTAWTPFSKRTHRCLTNRFPYGIIYQIIDENLILIVAIAHLHRKPGYWKDRIET